MESNNTQTSDTEQSAPVIEQPIIAEAKPPKRKLKIALIASVVALVIISAGVVAFALSSTNIPENEAPAVTQVDTTETTPDAPEAAEPINPSSIPLGDGKYGSEPRAGYIYSCQSNFNGPGAFKEGPWIDTTKGVWSKSGKNVTVNGDVTWENAEFTINQTEQTRDLIGNGLPINHGTGTFPISSSDDAYSYDRNPNSIRSQSVSVSLPLNPTVKSEPTCLSMGPIGYSTNGVALYNALDAGGRDAAAHEIQDTCGGHPERSGSYHYHDYSDCINDVESEEPLLVGYALDGFGIFKYEQNPTNAELDECHGKTGQVMWDGKMVTMYHYVVTTEYPYTLGCLRG